jgi:hypothetical protein
MAGARAYQMRNTREEEGRMSKIIIIDGGRFELRECISCGVLHAMPAVLTDRDRETGGYRYCPNGHQQGWPKEESEETKIRRERDRLKQDAARLNEEMVAARNEAFQQRERAIKSEAAAKRMKKRASAGSCPCCQRTFSNMAEHMKHQHPDFVVEGGAKIVPIKRNAS